MYCFMHFILVNFFGLLCFQQFQNFDVTGVEILNIKGLQDNNNYYKRISNLKNLFEPSSLTQQRNKVTPRPKTLTQDKKLYRRDVPFQTPFLGIPLSLDNEQVAAGEPTPLEVDQFQPVVPKIPAVKPLVKPNETEAERAERIHKSFERLLTFVEIVGQVDNYLSSKWKNLVRTVSNFYEVEDEPFRLSAKRVYGPCPHSH